DALELLLVTEAGQVAGVVGLLAAGGRFGGCQGWTRQDVVGHGSVPSSPFRFLPKLAGGPPFVNQLLRRPADGVAAGFGLRPGAAVLSTPRGTIRLELMLSW